MQTLLDDEVHLVVSCNSCRHSVRLTPLEAAQAFGADADMVDILARVRCSWCGKRAPWIDARPCSLDTDALSSIFYWDRQLAMWPEDKQYRRELARATRAIDAVDTAFTDGSRRATARGG